MFFWNRKSRAFSTEARVHSFRLVDRRVPCQELEKLLLLMMEIPHLNRNQ